MGEYIGSVIIIGDMGAGKSWLMGTYIEDHPFGTDQPTVGIDRKDKTEVCNNKTVKMRIIDTAGSEENQANIIAFLRGTDIIILCYDPTSYQMIQGRFKRIIQQSDAKKVFLVATKADRYDDQMKEKVEQNAETLKAEWHADYHYVTSAYKETKVHELFSKVAECLLEIKQNDPSDFIDISKSQETKERCC